MPVRILCVFGLVAASCAVLAGPALAADQAIGGVVRDGSGGVIVSAHVSLLTTEQAIVRTARTDDQGRFVFSEVRPGRYVLVVAAPGFAEARLAVVSGPGGKDGISVTLSPQAVRAEVTVTADRGVAQDESRSAQAVSVIGAEDIALRAKAVVAQAVGEETGAHLLRTSPTMAGIYVRGLTGNKVTVFVDGVRYSTASARGGVNTFLDLVEPTSLEGIEILRGPNSAQYGSDAIGGSVQFLSHVPTFAVGSAQAFRGLVTVGGGTADDGTQANAALGYSRERFGVFASLAARHAKNLRVGQGVDSHAAPTRFLGISSDRLMPAHLPDTGFAQYGGMFRLSWAPTVDQHVMLYYSRSLQANGKRYDQLLGGDGNLVADLRDVRLDFFYAKYQRIGGSWFDQVTATYSYNSQREERVNQGGNGNPNGSITHEYERTNVHGFQANATKRLGSRQDLLVGGEFYPERVHAPSYAFNPVSQATTVRRGRVPDNASYRSGAIYAQDAFDVVPDRLQLVANARFSTASYESLAADSPLVNGSRLWPDDSLRVSTLTFRAGAVVTPPGIEGMTITGNVSRGFRAPHVTDLGTVGLTGSGFQVSASGVQGMNATVGSSASGTAISTGRPVEQVKPETSLSYEAGVHYRTKRVSTALSVFVNTVYDNIAYQALILPSGSVGRTLGDQVITSQSPNGVVYVPASSTPVLVRTNFGDARIYGVEHRLDWKVSAEWSIGTVFTYLHAADTATGLPPNIEGGTPAPDGYLKIRYVRPKGAWWIEAYVHAAAEQSRLSTLDLEDRRTGATRSLSSIRSFFYNGATARGWVGPGPDGIAGNADDVLLLTGETLAQVQNRVFPSGAAAPLYTAVPSYTTVGFRGGFKVGARHEVTIDFENVRDSSYRGIAWGIDGPGRAVSLSWRARF